MDDEHAEQLRRMDSGARHGGGTGRARQLREDYGRDEFIPGKVLIFEQIGEETVAAVKEYSGKWRLTGHRRLRTWDGLLNTIGRGYEVSVAAPPETGPGAGFTP